MRALSLPPTLILAGLSLLGRPTAAEQAVDPVPANERFDRGVRFFEAGDFHAALAEFEAAYQLNHRNAVLVNIGMTQKRLFQYADALATFSRYLDVGGAGIPARRRRQVEQEISEMRSHLAEVTVRVLGAPADIEVDGRPAGRTPLGAAILLTPGRHTIRASRREIEAAELELEVVSGVRRDVELAPRPAVRTPTVQELVARGAPLWTADRQGHLVRVTARYEVRPFAPFEQSLAQPTAPPSAPQGQRERAVAPWYRSWPIWLLGGIVLAGATVTVVALTH
jgi:hypothetical protein